MMRFVFILMLVLLIDATGYGKIAEKPFSQSCCEALDAILHYDLGKAETLIESIETKEPGHIALPYLKQYKSFIIYLANDSQANYEAFIKIHEKSTDQLRSKPEDWHYILSSNMLLQKSMVEFSRGNQFQGALALYRAHSAFREIESNNDNNLWHLKLRGIFNVLWDRIPDNWRFVSNLAGMKGDYHMGIRQLVGYHDGMNLKGLDQESKIILIYVHKLFQHDNEDLVQLMEESATEDYSPITQFLYSDVLIKMNHGQKALEMHQSVTQQSKEHFPLLQYQYAKLLAAASLNALAKNEMHQFINHYRGESFKPDSYLQMSRICFLEGETDEAAEWSLKCIALKTPLSTIDRQAVAECRLYNQWQPTLLRARLYFDFGDYEKAKEWASKPITFAAAKIEQQYRKGRIAHKMGNLQEAIDLYETTIALSAKETRYYGPYAALYCAEIKIAAKEYKAADQYLTTARKLNNGEYQQDIEYKIKTYQKQIE